MSIENKQPQPTEVEAQETPEQVEAQVQENETELRLAEIEKNYKNEIAGLNRAVSKLTNQLKESERAKMSEEEKAKDIIKDAEERIAKADQKEREYFIKVQLQESGLPANFAGRVIGTTEEEIERDIATLKETFSGIVNEHTQKEVTKRFSTPDPKGGQSPESKTITRVEFDGLNPIKQSELMKGGYIIKE